MPLTKATRLSIEYADKAEAKETAALNLKTDWEHQHAARKDCKKS